MTTGNSVQLKNTSYNAMVYLCAWFSCLVPRYIPNFKIHVGIYISLFTIAVFITWVIFVRKLRFYKNIESSFFFIWFIVIVGAGLGSQRLGIWASYVDWILTAILFMQIIYYKPDQETFEVIIRAIVDALFIQLLIGIYEVVAHRYLFETGRVAERLYGHVAISMFHNLNDYVTIVVTLMPFAIFLLLRRKGLLNQIYYAFIIIASVALVIKSESRSGYLGLIIIGGTVVYLFWKRSKKNRVIIGAVFLIIISLAVVIPEARSAVGTVVDNIINDRSGQSDFVRINMIKNGAHFLKETYGFGVGAGNLHYWLSERTIYPVNNILYMHNWYMEIMVTFGVLFFLLYAVLHIKIIVSLLKRARAERHFWTVNNTFLISFIGFTLVSVASSSNIFSEWVWMYLILVSTYVLQAQKSQLKDKYKSRSFSEKVKTR